MGKTRADLPAESEALLDKLTDERWDALFAESQHLLAALAAQAVREHEAGLTDEFDPDGPIT